MAINSGSWRDAPVSGLLRPGGRAHCHSHVWDQPRPLPLWRQGMMGRTEKEKDF